MQAVDGMVAQLMEAALKNDPDMKIVIVSAHGFLAITHIVNLYIPFVEAGLIQFGRHMEYEGETTVVASWKAQLWPVGGVTAVMLHDPADTATRERVSLILSRLAADPNNGIDRVFSENEIRTYGGFPGASFLIVMRQGYTAGAAQSGPVVVEQSALRGSHGFLAPVSRDAFIPVHSRPGNRPRPQSEHR